MIMRLIARLTSRRRGHRLDRRWRVPVERAEEDRRRFERAVRSGDGVVAEADLARIGSRLDDTVREVRDVAARGQRLDEALRDLPNRSFLEHQLDNMLDRGLDDDDARVSSARYQLDAIDSLRRQVREVEEALERIDADIDRAVTLAVETSLRAGGALDEGAGAALDEVVRELDALNAALDELDDLER